MATKVTLLSKATLNKIVVILRYSFYKVKRRGRLIDSFFASLFFGSEKLLEYKATGEREWRKKAGG